MRKKIKKIATSGIVGTLLFVSSGRVQAQNTILPTKPSQRNETSNSGVLQEDLTTDSEAYSNDDFYGESKQDLLNQGFNPSQIQKLSRWNEQ